MESSATIENRELGGCSLQRVVRAPFYSDELVTLYHGDAREIVPTLPGGSVTVTDPPYNVGYHYEGYADNLPVNEYAALLRDAIRLPAVVIHYPEEMFEVSLALGEPPTECVAWTYNAHTPRKWRMAAWFRCKPDFGLVKQPYKNLSDKRIVAKLENGSEGCSLYDWWHDEQVKNVSEEKTEHPCQIPESVMAKVVRITPAQYVLDPFAGSGTTLLACKNAGIKAIGIELNEQYCKIIARRMAQGVLAL